MYVPTQQDKKLLLQQGYNKERGKKIGSSREQSIKGIPP